MNIKKLIPFIFIIVPFWWFFGSSTNKSSNIKNVIESPVKQREVYIGAWVGGFWDNDKKLLNTEPLTSFEENIGTKVAFANIYSEWEYLSNPNLIQSLNEISVNGWTPIISANPYFFEECKDESTSIYRQIADGKCDNFLKKVAANLKSYGKPIFLRFAWEMNLPDMYWSIEKTKSTPDDFREAWKHFYSILKNEGADNVVWVLSFNTSHSKTVPYKDLYPGDNYVDWVAIDGYNWGNSHEWSSWVNFSGVFWNSYKELINATNKPVMLSEVNSAPSEFGGNKAEWLKDMLDIQIPDKFSQIEAVVFFNEEKEAAESIDWRLEKSQEYLNVVKDPLNNGIYKSTYP